MSMYTRCSTCSTHFRVTVQQLQACAGQVRCGRCTTVFDAFATLTARPPGKDEEPPSLDASVRTGLEPVASAAAVSAPISATLAAALSSSPSPSAAQSAVAAYSSSTQEALAVIAGTAEAATLAPALSVSASAATEPLTLPDNLFAHQSRRALPGPNWIWKTGLGTLAALAVLQMLFLFRAGLAESLPGTRPLLLALCKPVGCEVPLPRYPDSLFIETSDLQVVDSARPAEVLLTATLRNRAEKLQAYPVLELTLTDTMDRAIAKRLFQPEEYLPSQQAEDRGFSPGSEISVRIMLNTGELRAAGYRLFLFFPG